MPPALTFLLHTVPEQWSGADYCEWDDALHLHGFTVGDDAWRAPTLRGPPIPMGIHEEPARGRFTVTVPEAAWRARPEDATRAVVAFVRVLSERVECVFGSGLDVLAAASVPRSLSERARLGLVTVLGADLATDVGQTRFDTLQGLIAESLPYGGVLLYPPLDGLPATRTPALDDMFRVAEAHLGVRARPWDAPPLVESTDRTTPVHDAPSGL